MVSNSCPQPVIIAQVELFGFPLNVELAKTVGKTKLRNAEWVSLEGGYFDNLIIWFFVTICSVIITASISQVIKSLPRRTYYPARISKRVTSSGIPRWRASLRRCLRLQYPKLTMPVHVKLTNGYFPRKYKNFLTVWEIFVIDPQI